MLSLPFGFTIFQYIGLWQPLHWNSKLTIKLYQFYSCFAITFLYTNVLSEIIELFRAYENFEIFINNLVVFLSMFGCSIKAASVLNQRAGLVKLIMTLSSHPCFPEDQNEELIQQKFDKTIHTRTILYVSVTGMTASLVAVIAFFTDGVRYVLPFQAWLPFDISHPIKYWIAYTHQNIAHLMGAAINAAYDTVIPGLMLQICAQFSILKHRLSIISETVQSKDYKSNDINKKEAECFANHVKHHLQIFQFAETLNGVFGFVFLIQFTISATVICVTVYSMSKLDLGSSDLTPMTMYLTCMLYQLFLFCYAGSEVITKSSEIAEAVHTIRWYLLNNSSHKGLLVMMLRSLKPIKFTTGHVIELSMESYTQVVKLSYSVYNVLKQSSE
ncbi:odorant receptor Or1-like [Chelonus insularis]|uniref:odorant receptor Or1-like n=1 Tax=Chelonus insularis TaxID=460826 RepID=UPI00158A2CDA|nr:odorant receptor Or1-like [Chelonus insularis]